MAKHINLNQPAILLSERAVELIVEGIRRGEIPVPSSGRRRYRDAGSDDGLHLLATASGATYYRIARRPGSETKSFVRIGDALRMKVAEARNRAKRLATGDKSAAAPVKVTASGPTCGTVWEAYLTASREARFYVGRKPPKESTLRSYIVVWRPHIEPIFRNKPLESLAAAMPKILAGLADRRAVSNRACQLISNLFRFAAAEGLWSGPNPMIDSGTGRLRKKLTIPSRGRHLSTEEAGRLFEALRDAPPHWRDFFTLGLMTGCRKGNLQRMAWKELDLVQGVWSVPTSKTGEPLVLPLPPEAVAILKSRREAQTVKSPFVFPRRAHPDRPVIEVDQAWQKIRTAAGLGDVRIHDLRRTVGSWAAQAGESILAIQRLLGLKSINAAAVYARADLTLGRRASNVVLDRLRTAASPGEPNGPAEKP